MKLPDLLQRASVDCRLGNLNQFLELPGVKIKIRLKGFRINGRLREKLFGGSDRNLLKQIGNAGGKLRHASEGVPPFYRQPLRLLTLRR